MDEKEKQRLFLIGLIVALLVFFTFVFWFGNFLTTESADCMKSPITYYEEKSDQLCYCNDGNGWNNPRNNNPLIVMP